MADKKVTTSALLNRIFQTSSILTFIARNKEQMKQTPFYIYINKLCVTKESVPERVIVKSGIARTYGHQLFNGSRKPSRDKVLQLAFGFEMNYDDTQELLKAARKSLLYPKIDRDAAVIFGLSKKLTMVEMQIMLEELALPILGKEDKYE